MIIKPLPEKHTASHPTEKTSKLLLVGEGLHILSPRFHRTIREQDTTVLSNMAREEVDSGALALAINLGPGREIAGLTPWVVDTIAGAVDVPLFLSAGVMKMKRLLEKHNTKITVNAVTADPENLTEHLKTAKNSSIDIVVLLVKPGLVPYSSEQRIQLAIEVVDKALSVGLPLDRLYLDPVISCRPDPVTWKISRGTPDIEPVLETISLVKELNRNIKTIAALGSGTLGMSREKRPAYQRSLLPLLTEAGLDAVIMNCFDNALVKTAQQMKKGNSQMFEGKGGLLSATA